MDWGEGAGVVDPGHAQCGPGAGNVNGGVGRAGGVVPDPRGAQGRVPTALAPEREGVSGSHALPLPAWRAGSRDHDSDARGQPPLPVFWWLRRALISLGG